MIHRNIIRVSEFEKLYYDDNKPFKKKHWEALLKYQENVNKTENGGGEFYKILGKGVQFTNYVGVIQAGNLTIEVLPKTDRQKTTAANTTIDELQKSDETLARNKGSWHDVLLSMLKECRLLQVNHVDYATLNLRSNSILEIYLSLFLNHTEKLLHEGLVKKYRKTEGNKFAMKGRLLFSKNISLNLIHKERFYVSYIEYNHINIFNQLLYKTLLLLPSLTVNSSLTDRVNRLLLDFPEMPDCRVNANVFGKLVFDRKTERYKEAMLIAEMLLLNFRPDIRGGAENVIAILFDMNKLWEEFVYRRLSRAASRGVTVRRQNKRNFWYNKTDDFYKTVRPDIVVIKNGVTSIIDTKWKIVEDNRPGDDDLRQMFVYNLLWDANQSILLYPGDQKNCDGSYMHFTLSFIKQINTEDKYFNHCSLAFIDLIGKDGKLIGNDQFSSLLNSL